MLQEMSWPLCSMGALQLGCCCLTPQLIDPPFAAASMVASVVEASATSIEAGPSTTDSTFVASTAFASVGSAFGSSTVVAMAVAEVAVESIAEVCLVHCSGVSSTKHVNLLVTESHPDCETLVVAGSMVVASTEDSASSVVVAVVAAATLAMALVVAVAPIVLLVVEFVVGRLVVVLVDVQLALLADSVIKR